jgi:hypothetical protein
LSPCSSRPETNWLRARRTCWSAQWSSGAAFRLDAARAGEIRDRVLQAARRLREFMDRREVTARDREYLKDAFPKEVVFVP